MTKTNVEQKRKYKNYLSAVAMTVVIAGTVAVAQEQELKQDTATGMGSGNLY
jgi:hypothetical protein